MHFSIIAAINEQGGIGYKNTIPWHISEDLKRFKTLTMGKTIVMGRNTWESIGCKPLPGRLNIILSTKIQPYKTDNVWFMNSFEEVIEKCKYEDEIFIIGGSCLYKKAMMHPVCNEIYLTVIAYDCDCDTFFPMDTLKEYFECIDMSLVYNTRDDIRYQFKTYSPKDKLWRYRLKY